MSVVKFISVLCLICRLSLSLPLLYHNDPSSMLADELVGFPKRLEDNSSDFFKYNNTFVSEFPEVDNVLNLTNNDLDDTINATDVQVHHKISDNETVRTSNVKYNITKRNQIRPGMRVTNYSVQITPNANDGTFSGRLVTQVVIIDSITIKDPVMFYAKDLEIDSVEYAVAGGLNYLPVLSIKEDIDNGILEIETGVEASLYTFVIEYRGSLAVSGQGLYEGRYDST